MCYIHIIIVYASIHVYNHYVCNIGKDLFQIPCNVDDLILLNQHDSRNSLNSSSSVLIGFYVACLSGFVPGRYECEASGGFLWQRSVGRMRLL